MTVVDVPSVCSLLTVRRWRIVHNVSFPVPRPAHRSVRLYYGGRCAYISAFASSLLIIPQKKCPNNTVAIAHDDDLRCIEDVVRFTPVQNTRIKIDNARSRTY
jgi:hypothetical protein